MLTSGSSPWAQDRRWPCPGSAAKLVWGSILAPETELLVHCLRNHCCVGWVNTFMMTKLILEPSLLAHIVGVHFGARHGITL